MQWESGKLFIHKREIIVYTGSRGFVVWGVITASIVFGFTLGLLFSAIMVGFA
jgi:hypothetical protein